jgi:NitT/TauT family transport system substrate-binding protein
LLPQGDSSTIKFVEIPFPAMSAAIAAGRVDSAWITEPFLTLAKQQNHVLHYGMNAISPQFLIGEWFTTRQWADGHTDALRRFRAVMSEVAGWANADHPKSAELLAKYTGLDPVLIASITRAQYGDRLT